ncbi:AAA family ATPase [Spirosoma endophyticum]|uniref:AAA domain-containing protein, putative AbiEii toxin, Type IV TA system n=1 Tax=Spirosoma endophyticum TaxID=662367 RepID=A0A1I2HP39_9BACT|nr:ATP-binding protein [Spirosoma endophyticum]SFF32115.1 AAA domain-containing protein, putative AbiEii toxin, Type IV TA system [Spirosoma endophyticum]
MIRVVINEKYKSLLEKMDFNLPDFTIISGINGAGKSHLLKAIEEKAAKVYESETELTPVKYMNSNSFNPNDAYQVTRESYSNEIVNIYNAVNNYVQQKRNQPDLDLQKSINNYNSQYYQTVLTILNKSRKPIEELTREDIMNFMPLYSNLVQDVFQQNFSAIFKRYADKYDDNAFNEYLKNKKGINKLYLSDIEFIEKHGTPPWEFVNQIFEAANIGYSINNPIEDERDMPYAFKLVNKTNGANVNFSDLSSGEKVLMSLTLALYNTKLEISFPKLLLLDEPDAPLHPSMAKQLLSVIQEVFVEQKKVKVIMTTHSPSTVAMAPDDSLFVMQKEYPRIEKKSKEQIMKLLTDGIPSFSIYADNRRQVIVESEVDVSFYSKVYDRLKKYIQNDKSLYFMPSGLIKGNTGNCDQVKKLVNTLANFGNQTIYGIIDWDNKNYGNEKIFILGSSSRYSLENYIYEPIILSNLLLREKIVERSYFGLEEDDTFYHFPSFPKAKLQKIVNTLVSEIAKTLDISDNSVTTVYYVNEISLDIPTWYLLCQGHKLEEAIKTTFPNLRKYGEKTKNEQITVDDKPVSVNTKLKEEIINKVIDDMPGFIPVDILTLLQNLHR